MHKLTLGSFDLVGGEGNGWTVETLADGASFGTAEGRDVIVQTLLQDGSAVTRDGYDNRELSFRILIKAADSLGLALGEQALAAEVGRRNELVWQPPDGWGPPSVFTVVMSSMSWDFDDWGEMEPATYGRPWVLSLTAKPFAQSADFTVIEAVSPGGPPPTPSTVTVDDCTSTTGWSVSAPSPVGTVTGPSVVSGAITAAVTYFNPGPATATEVVELTRSGLSSAMGSTPLLRVQASAPAVGGVVPSVSFRINGSAASPLAQVFDVYYFDCSAISTLTSFTMRAEAQARPGRTTTTRVDIQDISRTNVPPSSGTGRQQFRLLPVSGSARTEGSLQISHESSSLGEVLAYTNKDDGSGYQPACRAGYRTGGGTVTPDSSAASGSSSPLNAATPETYDIPSRSVPEGTYAPVARLKATSAGYYNVTLSASLLSGTTELGSVTSTRVLNLTTSFALYELGALSLPSVAVPPGSQAKVRLELSSDGAVQVDDTYIFNLTLGALTWVDCGTGTPSTGGASNRLWIDTASLDVPRPAIWVGTQADRSDAHHIEGSKVRAEMPHRFEPGDVNLFTVTSNALYAAASLSFRPAWHSNAAA